MAQKQRVLVLALCILTLSKTLFPMAGELFAKASASRTYSREDTFAIDISGATGLAIAFTEWLRLEGRFTLRQHSENRVGTEPNVYRDVVTRASVYTLGLDIQLVGDKRAVQPYIVGGAGYSISSTRFTYDETGETGTVEKKGISAYGGLGFRVRVARSFALELEGFAYVTDPQNPNPLIDFYANAGIRIFL